MLETLLERPFFLNRHREAPLLREREVFLGHLQQQGTCPWRITELGQNRVFFWFLIPSQDARCHRPFHSFDRHRRPAGTAGRPPCLAPVWSKNSNGLKWHNLWFP